MTIEQRFGQRVREIRHRQQISQEELAFRCNLSKNYVSDVERGTRNISLKVIEKFAKECGWSGQIDIDIFDIGGKYYISEVNPRFGGGYPHAYECGCDHMTLIKNNLKGIENKKNITKLPPIICKEQKRRIANVGLT